MEQTLIARRKQAEDTFNELNVQKEQKQVEVDQITEEMNRIQGEYRLINELIETEQKPKKAKSSKADVIDVTKVEGA